MDGNLLANAGDSGSILGPGRFHMSRSNCTRRIQLLKPASRNGSACELQLLKSVLPEPVLCSKRSHRSEKPAHPRGEQVPLSEPGESPPAAAKTRSGQNKQAY